MGDRELTDLANVLLTAAGAGLALACGYLVMKPATRTLKKWVGASLVALPGLLLGLMLAHPQLGVRSAYGGLTDALLGSSNPLEETFNVDRPAAGEDTSSGIGGAAGAADPSVAPDGGTTSPGSGQESPVETVPGDPSSSTPPPPNDTEPPPPTETSPPPPTETSPPPPTETSPPPPTETSPPPPTDTEPPPPTDTEPPPPPPTDTEPPPPPPPEPSPT